MALQLLHIKKLPGSIIVKTGLHIGAGRDTIEIGGMDNPIMVNPVNGEPYIPGSSIKGKMRSLLEVAEGKITDGDVHQCDHSDCTICRVFGSLKKTDYGPTRVVVRDAQLDRAKTRDNLNLEEGFGPRTIIEEKYENSIDRIQGAAKNPRPIERVVPGTAFKLEILYKVYDVDGDGGRFDNEAFSLIEEGLRLIELDYLGGSGSRGSGQVRFELNKVEEIEPNALQEKVMA